MYNQISWKKYSKNLKKSESFQRTYTRYRRMLHPRKIQYRQTSTHRLAGITICGSEIHSYI